MNQWISAVKQQQTFFICYGRTLNCPPFFYFFQVLRVMLKPGQKNPTTENQLSDSISLARARNDENQNWEITINIGKIYSYVMAAHVANGLLKKSE